LRSIESSTKTKGAEKNMSDMLQSTGDSDFLGDPDCPYCHGFGFVGKDVPFGHPEFGKLKACVCRERELAEARQKKLYELSNLGALQEKTFENFKARGRVGLAAQQADSLEQAYNSAVHFAGTLQGWLLLLGRYGCGKTHLAAAIANQAVVMGMETLFLTVPDLLDWLRFAYSDNASDSFEERFETIRDVPLLVMDDFGTQNATAWAQEKLFQILNYRYINHLATVITSNNPLSSFEGRIRSRLMDPELVARVEILATDYRNPADDIGHPELSSLNLHARKTFESFSMRRDEAIPSTDRAMLKDALDAARAFARDPQGWLVFIGPFGCGKTHLAAAIGNYHAQLGNPPLMVVVPDLLDHLRAAFAPNSSVSLDQRFEEIRSARLLILDDLGTQSATPWAREKIYQLFNYRYNAELPTVITTVNAPGEMDPRLQSRLSDTRLCKIVIMSAPPYTGSGKGQASRPPR